MYINDKYEAVIGLEVHAQLSTHSKIFASDSTLFGASPNTQVSAITMALPGVLPKLNREVVEKVVMMGLACNSNIAENNSFDRKNYFYPDLPKGYQISQAHHPICKGGYIDIEVGEKRLRIKLDRIHLEEDAGKNNHEIEANFSLIDLNRAGVPLIEIVTEPVLSSSDEAFVLLTEIRKLVRYLDVCDGNMEEGSLRCDANVSIRLKGEKELGIKVEVKNMNSIRNVKKAIEKEIERQIELTENGGKIIQQTRSFDPKDGTSFPLRSKEFAHDYRYFPEPDLPPIKISESEIARIRKKMPILPEVLKARLQTEFDLSAYDSSILTDDKNIVQYFLEAAKSTSNYKALTNWLIGSIKSYLNEKNLEIDKFSIQPYTLALLIKTVDDQLLSLNGAKTVFYYMIENGEFDPLKIGKKLNLIQDSNEDQLEIWAQEVLNNNLDKAELYKKGKKGLIAFFMGELMKISKGKADPKKANYILIKKLSK